LEETILTIVIPCPDFWYHVYQNNYCKSVYGTLLYIKVRDIQMIKKGGKGFYYKEDVMLLV